MKMNRKTWAVAAALVALAAVVGLWGTWGVNAESSTLAGDDT